MNDNKKINKTRRQRGYTFENTVVKRFNEISHWNSKRLGSPSTHLPDFDALSDMYKSIVAGEAKSGTSNSLYIPKDQIERCIQWVNRYALYQTKYVVLAFKFSQVMFISAGVTGTRKLIYYYKVWPHKSVPPQDIVCDYDGRTYLRGLGQRDEIILEDFKFED